MKNLTFLLILCTLGINAICGSGGQKDPPIYVKQNITVQLGDQSITLRAGTPVVVEAIQTYDSKSLSPGQSVNVRVKFNVVSKKQTLISAGALGTAIVSNVKKPGSFGKSGKLELQIQSVQAVDGQQILLSGIPLILEGENRKGLAWGLSIGLFIFTIIGGAVGLLIKGKDAEFRAGTTINSSTASDMEVEIQ